MTRKFWLNLIVLCGLLLAPGSVSGTYAMFGPAAEVSVADTDQAQSLSLQEIPPAQTEECDPEDHGCTIKDLTREYVDLVCENAELVSQDDLGVFPQSLKEDLNNNCKRAGDWVDSTPPADFKGIGLNRGAQCAVVEYDAVDGVGPPDDGNNDGICEPLREAATGVEASGDGEQGKKPKQYKDWEWCEEVSNDGIGNDNGRCEVYKEKQKGGGKPIEIAEVCVQVCGVEAIDQQDENFNEDKLIAMEGFLDDAIDGAEAGNAMLAQRMEELRALRATSSELTSDPEKCVGLLSLVDGQDRPSWLTLAVMLDVARVADGVYDQVNSGLNQDGFGFNGAAGAVVLATIKGIAWIVYEQFELLDDAITGQRLDNAVQCLEYFVAPKLQDIVNAQGSSTTQITTKVQDTADELKNQITAHDEEMQVMVNQVQSKQDNVTELRRVHLQVIEIKEKQEFLVSATEGGRPLAGVEFLSVRVSSKDPFSFTDVTGNTTVDMVEQGIYLVQIDLPSSARNAEIFAFEVLHSNEVEHYGFALFDRTSQANLDTGQ